MFTCRGAFAAVQTASFAELVRSLLLSLSSSFHCGPMHRPAQTLLQDSFAYDAASSSSVALSHRCCVAVKLCRQALSKQWMLKLTFKQRSHAQATGIPTLAVPEGCWCIAGVMLLVVTTLGYLWAMKYPRQSKLIKVCQLGRKD